MRKKCRAGVAMHLIMALLLTLSAIASAVILSRNRSVSKISAEVKVKADYEIESALVMQYQKIKYDIGMASETLAIPSHMIAPGLVLEVITNKVSANFYQIKAQVIGLDFYKSISARVLYMPDADLPNQWKMFYIKGG